MNVRLPLALLITAWMAGMAGCGSTTATTKRDNLAHLYGRGGSPLHLQARIFHGSNDVSTLFFKLSTRDLLYKSDGAGSPYRAVVRIRYEAFAEWNARTPLDSASVLVEDKATDTSEDQELIGSILLKRSDRRSYVLRVTAHDLHRDNTTSVLLHVDRDSTGFAQYFLPVDPDNGLPLFADNHAPGKRVRVRSDVHAGRTLLGTHHPHETALPPPVFTTGSSPRGLPTPDSTFTVMVDTLSGSFEITLSRPGILHFRLDDRQEHGLSLFAMQGAYPHVASAADMLPPLRYITSMQEFERLGQAGNLREALERFWLDAAGDRERAREAIRIYYSRVENANRHFTTHVEGWRTDRGLVHIIFGIPNTIYRSERSETWIFGEENNLMSLTFNFIKRSNPFSDNDLVLERDPLLKGAWYRNVESWRNGRVYQN